MLSESPATIRPVILCGGAGTRLWPVSREQSPKQFLPLMGERSLLQQTATRLNGVQFAPVLIVTGENQRFLIEHQLRDAGAEVSAILLEPVARNTASAAALAAAWLEAAGDELMLLMPSDHIIGDREAFVRAIEIGTPHAQSGAVVTFGAEPTEPNSEYGYIEADAEMQVGDGAYRIARFHEKPSKDLAAEYLATGRFFWNCGIFLAKASTILGEMRRYLPETLDAISQAIGGATHEGVFVRPKADQFARAENVSIDNGVMEKTSLGVVVPVRMQWSDVGAWDAVWKLATKDQAGNVTQGDVMALDCRNSLLRNDGHAFLGAVGLDRTAIIAVDDAIFVAPLARASEVKQLVAKRMANFTEIVREPVEAPFPSPRDEVLCKAPRFEVRHLLVDPGQTIEGNGGRMHDLQWTILSGTAAVTVEGKCSVLRERGQISIPARTPFSLANQGAIAVELLQVQFG